jgi:hypothetical protein
MMLYHEPLPDHKSKACKALDALSTAYDDNDPLDAGGQA